MEFGLGLVLSFTDNATSGINSAVQSLGQLTQMAENASTSLEKTASLSAFSVISNQIGETFTSMGSSILSTLTQVVGKVNETGQTLMYAENQLNALYASSGKTGKEVIAQIQEYAKTSMFEFENLIPAVTSLKSVGIEAFDAITSSTGNATYSLLDYASALASFAPQMTNAYGTGINAAIGAMREYIAEGNAMSLKRGAGLDITGILGEEKGATIEERTRQVADLVETLGMMPMVDMMSESPTTKLSNMGDTLFQFVGMVSESGVYEAISGLIDIFADFVSSIDDSRLQNIAKSVGSALSSLIKPIESVAKKLVSLAESFLTLLENNPAITKFVAIGSALAGVLLTLVGIVLKVSSAFSGFSLMMMTSGTSFKSILSLLSSGALKITGTILPLAAVFSVLALAWNNDIGGIKTTVTNFVSNLSDAFNTAKQAVSGSVEDLTTTLEDLRNKDDFFSNLTIGIMKVIVLVQSLVDVWNDNTLSDDLFAKATELGILPLIEAILDLKYRFEFFKQGFIDGWNQIAEDVKTAISGFTSKIEGTFLEDLLDDLTAFLDKLTSGDTQAWYDFGVSFAEFTANVLLFKGALKATTSIVTPFVKAFEALSKLKFGSVFGKLGTEIENIVNVLKGGQGVSVLSKLIEVFKGVASGGLSLHDALTVVFGSVGTTIAGIVSVVTGAVTAVVNFIDMLKNGFSWLNEILMVVGIAIAAVGAVILGAPAVVAAVVAAIIAAVATLVVLIKDHWEEIKEFFSTLGTWINDNVIQTVKDFFTELWDKIVEGVSNAIQKIKDFFSSVATWIDTNVVQPVSNFFSELWNSIVTGIDNAVNWVSEAVESIKNFFSTIANWIYTNVIEPVVNFFSTYIFPIIEKIGEIVAKIVEIVVTLVQVAVQQLKQKITEIVENIRNKFNEIVSWIDTNVIQPVKEFFSALWDSIVEKVKGFVDKVRFKFYEALLFIQTEIVNPIREFFYTLWDNIVEKITNFVEKAKTIIGAITEWINTNIITPVSEFFSNLWDGIVEKVTSFVDRVKEIFTAVRDWINDNIIAKISEFFTGLWEKIKTAFQTVADTISSVLKGAVNTVLDFICGVINSVINGINSAIDVINAIPGVSITKISLLEVPRLAEGGVIDKPTIAQIGEAGKEAVVPLENNLEWISSLASMLVHEMAENLVPSNTSSYVNNNQGDNNQKYLTNNSTNATYEGDTDNSVVFNDGAIQIIVQNASEDEALRFAQKVLEYIKRQKELDAMMCYA